MRDETLRIHGPRHGCELAGWSTHGKPLLGGMMSTVVSDRVTQVYHLVTNFFAFTLMTAKDSVYGWEIERRRSSMAANCNEYDDK
jgi:hypothetical protein